MNLFALVQMTTHISQASVPSQQANSLALTAETRAAAPRPERLRRDCPPGG